MSDGMIDGAHPTAPGGMSQRAIAEELVEKHGYTKAQIRDRWREAKSWRVGSWPEMIDVLCEERRAREMEEQEIDVEGACVLGVEGHLFCDCEERPAPRDGTHGRPTPEEFISEADDSVDEAAEILAEIEKGQAEAASEALFIGMPHTRDFIFDGHAGAGPSGAERWMNCTASLGMARKFLETLTPNQQREFAGGSAAARQGTTAHSAGEAEIRLLLGEIDADERDALLMHLTVMPESEHEAYDEEMAEYVSEYVDLINTYIEERGEDHVMVEQRLEAAVPLPDDTVHTLPGSGDTVILPTKTEPDLVVVDYKHGNGIDVDVDSNPQVRIYGLGALALLIDDEGNLITDVKTVTYHIVQPRLGGIKTWTETLDELLDWRDEVLAPALYAALTGTGAVFAPSESTCQWCPARGTCPALAEQRVEQAADLFDTIVEAEYENGAGAFPETDTLDNTRLGSLLGQIEGLVQIKDDLRAEAQRRLHRGEEVPGYKLVGYTPPKKWVEGAAEALAEDEYPDLWVHKMLTPKQAYTLLKKSGAEDIEATLDEYHDHPVQKPVIARADDRRHEWKGAPPEQMFTDLDADEGGEE